MSASTSNLENQHASSSGSSTSNGGLWSSILASTVNSAGARPKHAPAKRLIVMGQPSSGKRTLLRAMESQSSRNSKGKRPASTSEALALGLYSSDAGANDTSALAGPSNLGVNFQYMALDDTAEDDPSSQVSVYVTSRLDTPPFDGLASLTLDTDSFTQSLAIIVLDWTRPWEFINRLRQWYGALQKRAQEIEQQGNDGAYWITETRERLENLVRNYQEPTARGADTASSSTLPVASSIASTSTSAPTEKLPLPDGSLAGNLGIATIVVCTKSDQITALERNALLTEEQIDFVQQCLRSICLHHGSALFSTSALHPSTFDKLRSYIQHRLFSRNSSSTEVHAPSRPYQYRANVIDREQLLVPTGWDSIGKIRVLREGFDFGRWIASWNRTLGTPTADSDEGIEDAVACYAKAVGDGDVAAAPKAPVRTEVQDEQDFLKIHYEILSREAAKRGASSGMQRQNSGNPREGLTQPNDRRYLAGQHQPSTPLSGTVGPMASTSLSLPTVEKALETARDAPSPALAGAGMTSAPSMTRRESSRQSNVNGHLSPLSPPLTSPSGSSGSAPQNEVLANFFQSLLTARTDKGSGSSASPSSKSSAPSHARTASSSKAPQTPSSRSNQ